MNQVTQFQPIDASTCRVGIALTVDVRVVDWSEDVFEQFRAAVQEEADLCVMRLFACDSCSLDLEQAAAVVHARPSIES